MVGSVRAEVDLTACCPGFTVTVEPLVIVVVPAPFSEPVFPHTSVPEIDRVPVPATSTVPPARVRESTTDVSAVPSSVRVPLTTRASPATTRFTSAVKLDGTTTLARPVSEMQAVSLGAGSASPCQFAASSQPSVPAPPSHSTVHAGAAVAVTDEASTPAPATSPTAATTKILRTVPPFAMSSRT